jgi:hypothetical protein
LGASGAVGGAGDYLDTDYGSVGHRADGQGVQWFLYKQRPVRMSTETLGHQGWHAGAYHRASRPGRRRRCTVQLVAKQ